MSSAGIAVRDGENPVDIVKAKGRLKILAEKTNDGKAVIVHVELVTPDGQLMENHRKIMLILIEVIMEIL